MINCVGIPCDLTEEKDWAPNSDVVGYGVLAAFVATAIFTFLAIILGYFTDSLPADYSNDADKAVVIAFRQSWIHRATITTYEFGKRFRRWLYQSLGATPPAQRVTSMSKAQRQDALKAFILSLSDQQLVTGIAILIGALLSPCEISILEFDVVMSLAWFSSFTHLATLDILRDYLRENKTVRNWRIFGMLMILGLLIYAFSVSFMDFETSSQSLACVLNQATFKDLWTFHTPLILLNMATILIMLYLVVGYTSRITNLFAEPGSGNKGITDFLLQLQLHRNGLKPPDRHALIHEAEQFRQQHNQITLDPIYKRRGMHRIFLALDVGQTVQQYETSFLVRIGSLFFSFSFGIAQTVYYMRAVIYRLPPWESTLDFGQIVPLVLLTLPLLAAAEAIYSKEYPPDPGNSAAVIMQPSNVSAAKIISLFAVHALLACFTGITLNSPTSDGDNSLAPLALMISGSLFFIIASSTLAFVSMGKLVIMQNFIKVARENREQQSVIALHSLQNVVTNPSPIPSNSSCTSAQGSIADSTHP